MAKKQAVHKTQAVRDYLNVYPAARAKEIAAALKRQGIEITLGDVTAIKKEMYKAAAPLEKPADTLTLDQIKMVAQAIKRIRSRVRTACPSS